MCLARIQTPQQCQLLCKNLLKERSPSNLPGPHLVLFLLLPWQHGSAFYPPDFDTVLSQSVHCAKGCITGRTPRMPLRHIKVGFPTLRNLGVLERWRQSGWKIKVYRNHCYLFVVFLFELNQLLSSSLMFYSFEPY